MARSSPARRAARGGRDPDQEPGDLHRRRPGRGAHQPRRRGDAAEAAFAAAGGDRGRRPPDRGARDRRSRLQLPEARRHPDGRRPRPALRVGAERDPELRQALDRGGHGRPARSRALAARRVGSPVAMRHGKQRHKLSRDSRPSARRCCATSARADRARADQDQPGQGQGGQARGREADHARQAGRPARAAPGAVDARPGPVSSSTSCSRRSRPRYAERPGGYTRIVKLGPRRSDSTEMVFLELV